MSQSASTTYSEAKWTAWRLTVISIISTNVLIVLILLLVYSDYLSEVQKIVSLIGAAAPTMLNLFRIKKGRKIPLVEFVGLPHVIAITIICSISIWGFFILALLPIHKVIATVEVDESVKLPGHIMNKVTFTWNGQDKKPTNDSNKCFIPEVRTGAHILTFQLAEFTRPESNIVNVELLPITVDRTYRITSDELLVSIVYFRTEPPGAEITIDRVNQHVLTNDYITLPAGDYSYMLTLQGYRPAEGRIALRGGKKISIVEKLKTQVGSLRIIGDSSKAAIYMNGKFTRKYSPAEIVCPVGEYRVEFQTKAGNDYGKRWDTTVVVRDLQSTRILRKLGPGDNERLYPLMIVTDPQADIYVQGRKEGLTNRRPVYLFEGDYSVTLERAGYHTENLPVRIPGTQYLDTVPLVKLAE